MSKFAFGGKADIDPPWIVLRLSLTAPRRESLMKAGWSFAILFSAALQAFQVQSGLAQTPTVKMNSEQTREERAYAAGVQVALWGRPFVDNVHTLAAGLKANAVGLNYLRKFSDLKTAADKFVNTPNNVSIDGYAAADLASEPVVVSVPPINTRPPIHIHETSGNTYA